MKDKILDLISDEIAELKMRQITADNTDNKLIIELQIKVLESIVYKIERLQHEK